jgi:hypothetical protein
LFPHFYKKRGWVMPLAGPWVYLWSKSPERKVYFAQRIASTHWKLQGP